MKNQDNKSCRKTNNASPRRAFIQKSAFVGAGMVLGDTIAATAASAMTEKNGMDVFDMFRQRRSVRNFQSTPVPDEHIAQIIDAAHFAPTSGNQQPWKFLVIRDRDKLEELKDLSIEKAIAEYKGKVSEEELKEGLKKYKENLKRYLSAPVYIIVLTDSESQYPSYNTHDGPLAAGYLLLAARALGYGSVYITDAIADDATREVFKIPARYQRVCITPIGIPVSWPDTPPKKEIDDMIIYDSF